MFTLYFMVAWAKITCSLKIYLLTFFELGEAIFTTMGVIENFQSNAQKNVLLSDFVVYIYFLLSIFFSWKTFHILWSL
jgi:hypothetical protein